MRKLTFLAIALTGLLVGVAAAVVVNKYEIPTTGTISNVTLSITWLNDSTAVTAFNWGATDNNTIYIMDPINITNTSNVPVNLTLSTENWVNIISLTLNWNYTGTTLQPNGWEVIELYQNVTATGPYSYNTVITATEA